MEHAATAVSEAVVRRLGEAVPMPTTGPLLTVACVEREWHALPAMVVALTLRARGCRVTYLGASASRDHLVSTILDIGPRAVLLSASLTSSLPRVRRQVEAVRGTGTPVVLGGRALDPDGRRAQRLGATAYARSPEVVLEVLAALPVHVPPAGPLRHPGAFEARSIEAESDTISRDVMLADRCRARARARGRRPHERRLAGRAGDVRPARHRLRRRRAPHRGPDRVRRDPAPGWARCWPLAAPPRRRSPSWRRRWPSGCTTIPRPCA